MASNKRRKLNGPTGSMSISAFAARKQLQIVQDEHEHGPKSIVESSEGQLNFQKDQPFDGDLVATSRSAATTFQRVRSHEVDDGDESPTASARAISESDNPEDEAEFVEAIQSRKSRGSESPESSEEPEIRLTTLIPSKDNIEQLEDGSLIIKIAPGERLVVLGEYGLLVIRGQITILGATLSASETVYAVYAPSSHSLPVIRFLYSDNDKAEIRLHQSNSGLRSLRHLSPLFARLWNENSSLEPNDPNLSRQESPWRSQRSSFQILFTTHNSRNIFYPIISPPEWNEAFSALTSGNLQHGETPVAMICGPKSSGKSTFAKLLINRLLTNGATTIGRAISDSAQRPAAGVAFLDLDPGQPEYSPPGQLYLIYLSNPNFGPPYSHPDASTSGIKMIRAHSIAAVSPSADLSLYIACVVDLFWHYRSMLLHTPCPLVINTPGWVFGTGLELLTDLIKEARPTEIIYMSQEGPLDVVKSLRNSAESIPLLTLPSQLTKYAIRTAAHLRTMQFMSYFHLDPIRKEDRAWISAPLTSIAPWEVRYAGKRAGIVGIMYLGEQPPIPMVRDTIDGTLVAIVVVDDMAAIPGWTSNNQDLSNSTHYTGGTSKEGEGHHVKVIASQHDPQLERPLIVQTPDGIPYFNPARATSLDPRYSHNIGMALIRGIDTKRRTLQLLTPVPASIIGGINGSGQAIVLLGGKLDTPGWAYTEELNIRAAMERRSRKQQASGASDDETEDSADEQSYIQKEIRDDFAYTPWIEKLEGDQGRGAGARVWRVRRDLGRKGGD